MTLSFKEYGKKTNPLIVFLHGGGVSSWMWEKQVEFFRDYHCMTIDLPGHGENKHLTFSIEQSARKINDIIEKHGREKKVIVVGFSLGAQVLIKMLSIQPQLIDYAIINSALVRPNVFMRKMIKPSIKMFFPLTKLKSFAKLQAKTLYIRHEQINTYYEESSQMKVETLIKVLEENMSFTIPHNFYQVSAKILVTVGEKEKAMMKKSAKDIVSSNENCTGIIIPKVGHGVSLYDPKYFNQLLENWLVKEELPEGVVLIKS